MFLNNFIIRNNPNKTLSYFEIRGGGTNIFNNNLYLFIIFF